MIEERDNSSVIQRWSQREGSTAGVRYASICWICSPRNDGEKAHVTIGWSLPDESGHQLSSGSWAFEVQTVAKPSGRIRSLPMVEESVGVLYPAVSSSLLELNDRCERLIADHLLLFAHYSLYGHANGVFEAVRAPGGCVDRLLVLGPRLPKLIGRLCYSHFTRRKTIAILSPRRVLGRRPRMSSGKWPDSSDQPDPPYYDDSAVRRWEKSDVSTGGEDTVGAFEIINGVGDGLGGQLIEKRNVGSAMWAAKASEIQELLAIDRAEIRAGVWQNVPVYLPIGMIAAIKAALVDSAERDAKQRWHILGGRMSELPLSDQQKWREFEHKLLTDTRFPPQLHNFVRCTALELFRKRESKKPESLGEFRLAARTTAEWNAALDELFVAVREQLGESVI